MHLGHYTENTIQLFGIWGRVRRTVRLIAVVRQLCTALLVDECELVLTPISQAVICTKLKFPSIASCIMFRRQGIHYNCNMDMSTVVYTEL